MKHDPSAESFLEALKTRQFSVVVAESCSGGLASSLLTDIPGASEALWGGYVVYSNDSKIRILGVKPETISAFGAVSEETVKELAGGALSVSGTDVAIAISGIAGPGGDSSGKPVGTVWLCAALRDGPMRTRKKRFAGDRAEIRMHAAQTAFELGCELLESDAVMNLPSA